MKSIISLILCKIIIKTIDFLNYVCYNGSMNLFIYRVRSEVREVKGCQWVALGIFRCQSGYLVDIVGKHKTSKSSVRRVVFLLIACEGVDRISRFFCF